MKWLIIFALVYTGRDSKIGKCQGGAQNLSQAELAPKQLKLNNLSDAGGLKDCGCPTSQGPSMMHHHWGKASAEPIFQSRAVYTEAEWLKLLGEKRYEIMRKKGTQHAYEYVYIKTEGIYLCAACGQKLFDAKDEYNAGNGYPSFKQPIDQKNVYYLEDREMGFKRYEVLCRGCDSHLGHVFKDGPPPKHLRYCINSICLKKDNLR